MEGKILDAKSIIIAMVGGAAIASVFGTPLNRILSREKQNTKLLEEINSKVSNESKSL